MSKPRLTAEQKNEIVRRYRAGENVIQLAAAFGVHSSYPGLLVKRRGGRLRASYSARSLTAPSAERREIGRRS